MTLGNSNQSRRRVVGGSLDTSELTQDQVGAMFSDNTETFIAATYQDGDGTIDLVVPVLDEDNLVSDSATDLATQQSIKAYVDGQNHGGGTTVTTGTDTGGADSTASGSYAELTNAPSVSIATGTTCLVLWAQRHHRGRNAFLHRRLGRHYRRPLGRLSAVVRVGCGQRRRTDHGIPLVHGVD